MLGNDGSAWLERMHMQIARNLKASDWSQAEIAEILGSTQSTISRMAHRDLHKWLGHLMNLQLMTGLMKFR